MRATLQRIGLDTPYTLTSRAETVLARAVEIAEKRRHDRATRDDLMDSLILNGGKTVWRGLSLDDQSKGTVITKLLNELSPFEPCSLGGTAVVKNVRVSDFADFEVIEAADRISANNRDPNLSPNISTAISAKSIFQALCQVDSPIREVPDAFDLPYFW